MTSIDWSLVEVASRLLERDEREAVLGGIYELSRVRDTLTGLYGPDADGGGVGLRVPAGRQVPAGQRYQRRHLLGALPGRHRAP